MFKLILVITLMGFGKNSAPITVSSSQGEYRFSTYEKCQSGARLILADKKFDAKEFDFFYLSRQAYCVEE